MKSLRWIRSWFTSPDESDKGGQDEQSDETIEFDVTIEEITITDESE